VAITKINDQWATKDEFESEEFEGAMIKEQVRVYLDSKTFGQLLELGEQHGIFADQKAQAFLYEKLGKKRKSWKSCKKSELKRVFLESGVDLAGKVPAEILRIE